MNYVTFKELVNSNYDELRAKFCSPWEGIYVKFTDMPKSNRKIMVYGKHTSNFLYKLGESRRDSSSTFVGFEENTYWCNIISRFFVINDIICVEQFYAPRKEYGISLEESKNMKIKHIF